MRKIDPYQMKKIYAIANTLKITVPGSRDDELHLLVQGVTGKDSIKTLTYKEAGEVIARLETLQGAQVPSKKTKKDQEHPSRPGGITSGQQRKVWALMYELKKYDAVPNDVALGDRLCVVIKKELGVDAIARCPFAWLDFKQGNQLIEVLKAYVANERRKRRRDGGFTG